MRNVDPLEDFIMKKTIYILFFCLLITASSKAEVLAEYTFTGGSLASTDLSAGSIASDFVMGPGAVYATIDPQTNLTDVIRINNTASMTTLYSDDGNQYHAFSITAKTGNAVTLTNIVFDLHSHFPYNTLSGVAIGVSTNGFSGYDPDLDFIDEYQFAGYNSQLVAVNIDISGFTEISSSSTIDLRMYFRISGPEAVRSYSVDNIVVTGIVPIGSSAIMIQ